MACGTLRNARHGDRHDIRHRVAVVAAGCLHAVAAAADPTRPADTVAPVAPVTPVPTAAEAPAAKRAAGQENEDPLQIFRAFGTEPFWNVNVEGTRLTYTTPEDQTGVVTEGARRATADGV